MSFITDWALRRRTVTILAAMLALAAGIFTYQTISVELFPEVEFPLVTVSTFYPSANPEAVVRDVTAPIESAIQGVDGLESIRSVSSENRSILLANFEFGVDMAEAESAINSSVNTISFPDGVASPIVGRVNPNSFPVLQLSVVGDGEISEIQEVIESRILPEISSVEGVFRVEVTGGESRRATVTVDADKMLEKGVSLFQVSQALRDNSVSLPGGAIRENGRAVPVKTTNAYESVDELRALVVGFSPPQGLPAGAGAAAPPSPVTLGEVADVRIADGMGDSIYRTNGKQGMGIGVVKEPDANTIDVTEGVLAALDEMGPLPSGIEIITVSDDGPQIQGQISTLEREAILGLILATIVVFAFFMTLRPTALRGMLTTLRPTLVIALSIPLSIFIAVLLISWQGLALNFMTLGGLAISVGRVVDDSIVVLENVYRYIQTGKDKWRAALDATVEVGPAITASTLATIVVFAPLGFIQGLVGAFFFPFALTVSFALLASLLVALTVVPALGAYLLRIGDLSDDVGENVNLSQEYTWMQRAYVPALKWALGHKAVTLVGALVITGASLSLLAFIPVNLFPSGEDRYLSIDVDLPPGTPAEVTVREVTEVENEIGPLSKIYTTTIGTPATVFSGGGLGGLNQANLFVILRNDAPEDTVETLRDSLNRGERVVNVREISQGPPNAGLDVSVTGSDYRDISAAAASLVEEFKAIEGLANVSSDVSDARDEIVVEVDPARASSLGLSAQLVAFQVNQFLAGQRVAQLRTEDGDLDVFLRGRSDGVNSVEDVRGLMIAGPMDAAPLGEIASVEMGAGPVTIVRTDGARSASITGTITSDDAQEVGIEIQDKIDSLDLPPGVEVVSGGIFQDIAQGFQDIFLAMIIGVALVYLVMIASLGSLRNPLVIVASMPLALIGVLVSLAVTGRALGLPALMGVLMLIGIVVTNAVVLISFVEQLRQRYDLSVYEALVHGGRIRLRPILMTAITTSVALLPLAAFVEDAGGIIGAELATVVIGGLASSTILTLVAIPVIYILVNESIPGFFSRLFRRAEAES